MIYLVQPRPRQRIVKSCSLCGVFIYNRLRHVHMRYVPCVVRRGISCLAVRHGPKKKPRKSKQAQSKNEMLMPRFEARWVQWV